MNGSFGSRCMIADNPGVLSSKRRLWMGESIACTLPESSLGVLRGTDDHEYFMRWMSGDPRQVTSAYDYLYLKRKGVWCVSSSLYDFKLAVENESQAPHL